MLKVDKLSFGYIKKPLCLCNVSFSLDKGQVLSVLGGEGMGKTALLRVISYLEKQFVGKITIDNKDINLLDKSKFLISYLPSSPVLFENKSIIFNLEYLFKTYNLKSLSDEDLEKLLKSFGIIASLKTKVKKLSSADKKILAIIRTYIKKPNLLLIDDQLNGEKEQDIIRIKNAIFKLLSENSALKYTISVSESKNLILNENNILYLSYGKGSLITFEKLKNYPIDLFSYNYLDCNRYEFVLKKEKEYFLYDYKMEKYKKEEVCVLNNKYKLNKNFYSLFDKVKLLDGEQIYVTLCTFNKLTKISDSQIDICLQTKKGHLFETATGVKIV